LLLAAGVLCAFSATACEVMTSLDGLTGGSSANPDQVGPTGSADAHGGGATEGGVSSSADGSLGSPPGDTGSTGALGDGGEGDSGSAHDAGAPLPDAAPTGYCALLSPAPLFCDDFDEGALRPPWNQVTGMNATVSLSNATAVSTPNAMLVTTVAGSQSVDGAGYKQFAPLTSAATTQKLDFDLRIEQGDQSNRSDAIVAAIQFYDSLNDVWDLQLEAYWDATTNKFTILLSEDGEPGDGGTNQYYSHTASAELAPNTWVHVTMELSMSSPLVAFGPATAKLSFDGTLIASASQLHIATTNPTPEILMGVTYVGSDNTGWTARYDDVTFASSP
jgi:hypothetical protein